MVFSYLVGGKTLEGVTVENSLDSSCLTLRRLGLDSEQLSHCLLKAEKSWQELDASRNQLTFLPTVLEQFGALTHLNLSCNHISVIPPAIYRHLTRLQYLNLSENQIVAIPEAMPICLSDLTVLCLDDNLLTKLPDTIGHWTKLEELRLGSEFGGNQIDDLPISLNQMSSLIELDVSFNHLQTLPSDIFYGLKSLRYLNLSHNQLTELSPEFESCRQLATLDLSNNFLTELSLDSTRDLIRLMNRNGFELLNLSHNQLQRIPTELLDQSQTQVIIKGNPLAEYHTQDITYQQSVRENEDTTIYFLPSLREISLRTAIIVKKEPETLTKLPEHLKYEIENVIQHCPYCQLPFVHEWISTTQLKAYRGHSSVVRQVRFCSTKCWLNYRELINQQMLATQSNVNLPQQQALEYISQHSIESNPFDWIMAAVIASNEQTQQVDLLSNTSLF